MAIFLAAAWNNPLEEQNAVFTSPYKSSLLLSKTSFLELESLVFSLELQGYHGLMRLTKFKYSKI